MYFAGYLSEELMGGPYTIAPGCTGESGGRCNFDEFMRYLWSKNEAIGDVDPPKGNLMNPKTNFATAKLATLLQQMNNYKKAGLKKPITGDIDVQKLFPGATDYYDAMRKCGGVMGTMRSFFDGMGDGAQKDTAKNLIARAQEAADMVIDYRAKDLDNNDIAPRLKYIEEHVGWQMTTKPGRDSSGRIGSYTVWDAAQSIKDNPMQESAIRTAWSSWVKDPANGRRYGRKDEDTEVASLIIKSQ